MGKPAGIRRIDAEAVTQKAVPVYVDCPTAAPRFATLGGSPALDRPREVSLPDGARAWSGTHPGEGGGAAVWPNAINCLLTASRTARSLPSCSCTRRSRG